MLRKYQKKLRKNLTDTETLLWAFLRNRRLNGFKFRRQQILQGFIVDFVCYEKKLIIELDGGQHNEQEEYDTIRTTQLEAKGFRILRFWNNDFIKNKANVLAIIYDALMEKYPSSALRAPSPTRGEGIEPSFFYSSPDSSARKRE